MKKFVVFIVVLSFGFSFALFAQEKSRVKTVYKYKKYEKFDFDEMVLEGVSSSPGDLSIMRRYQQKYRNRLPYRRDFNYEIRKAVGRIR